MRTSGAAKGPSLDRERMSPRQRMESLMHPPSPITQLLSRPTSSVALPPQGEATTVQTRGGPMHPPSPPPPRPSRPTSSVSFPPSGRDNPSRRRTGNPTDPAIVPALPSLATGVVGAKGPPMNRERSSLRRRTGSLMPPPLPMTPLLSRPTLSVALPHSGRGHHRADARGSDAPAVAASLAADMVDGPPPIREGPSPRRRAGNSTAPNVTTAAPSL